MDYYNIYHPFDAVINNECHEKKYCYEYIGMVKAKNLSQAFSLAQNDFNEDYLELGKRSTCVGDIISGPDNVCYMVMGSGFKRVPAVTLMNLDLMLNDNKVFETVGQQMLDNPEDYGLI
jgi:hypothetical protein